MHHSDPVRRSILMQQWHLPMHNHNTECQGCNHFLSTIQFVSYTLSRLRRISQVPLRYHISRRLESSHKVFKDWDRRLRFPNHCRVACQAPDSIWISHLISIGNPIMEIRRSYGHLISIMGFPIPVRRYLYIESGPSFQMIWQLWYPISLAGSRACEMLRPCVLSDTVTDLWAPFTDMD